MNEQGKTLCPHHSVAEAKRTIERGEVDYIPIVGIVSSTDLARAPIDGREGRKNDRHSQLRGRDTR